MRPSAVLAIALIVVGVLGLWWMEGHLALDRAPARPNTSPATQPDCPGPNCPRQPTKPKKPWGEGGTPVGAKVGGEVAPDGTTRINCDLPDALQMKNIGGSDGAGLCVFTSIAHSARWQNVAQLEDFQAWMKKHPGGGYPDKVTKMISQKCKEAGMAVPSYVQVEGKDLEILKLASRTGRMPAVTYSKSPTGRYGGGKIAHMVSLPHASDQWFAVLDNNFPGSTNYEWMSPEEFSKVCNLSGSIWSVILLAPPPAPNPWNGK